MTWSALATHCNCATMCGSMVRGTQQEGKRERAAKLLEAIDAFYALRAIHAASADGDELSELGNAVGAMRVQHLDDCR